MRDSVVISVALIITLSGCILPSGTPTDRSTVTETSSVTVSVTDSPPSETGTATQAELITPEALGSNATACHQRLSVSFWGDDTHWEPDLARMYYTVPENTSIFFVAYVDGQVRGVKSVDRTDQEGIVLDGASISLNASFSGPHTVQIVAYTDTDRNGQFTPQTDRPCLVDGELAQADPQIFNFSRFRSE